MPIKPIEKSRTQYDYNSFIYRELSKFIGLWNGIVPVGFYSFCISSYAKCYALWIVQSFVEPMEPAAEGGLGDPQHFCCGALVSSRKT